jgi:bifunctional DNA-binding transcriptional regulator/antitoxin component of YhaV-PrlF toxin-antitoxin module
VAAEIKEGRRRRRGTSRLSRHNQITVPVAILDEVHLGPGDEVDFTPDGDGRFIVTRRRDPLEEFIGSVPGLEEAVDQESLRNEWER